jgi:transposase-like protein
MSLSQSLTSVKLTFECPICKFAVVKKGSWFQVVSQYQCEGCGRAIRITYSDKIAIFKKHEHLTYNPLEGRQAPQA